MNADTASNLSSPGSSQPARVHRGAIASQACETCRSRKQKCDESRPKCGLCSRIHLDCVYREPVPTKKDKTLVEILERLKSLEGKVDRIPTSRSSTQSGFGFGPRQNSPSSQPSFAANTESGTPSQIASAEGVGRFPPYRHASAAHKILAWPAIQQLLVQVLPSNAGDLKLLEQDGSKFLIRVFNGQPRLNLEASIADQPFRGMQSERSRIEGGPRITFPGVTRDRMYQLTTAYFDSFNLLFPFMDRRAFESDTLQRVISEGFDGDVDSVVALLVFALGEVALEGMSGSPIGSFNGLDSGVKGGTSPVHPPGLSYFNEARKSLGFVFGEHQLVNVQIFSLAALYFQSCCRYVDFWRMTGMASQACYILVTCNSIDYDTQRGDLIRRALWHCIIMETSLHLELDLQPSGIVRLGEEVGMPSFNTPFCEADHRANQSTNFESHFASSLALRRLCAQMNSHIYDASTGSDTTGSDESGAPSAATIKGLAVQLAQWRSILPRDLQWPEDDPTAHPSPQTGPTSIRLDPNLAAVRQGSLFTPDLRSPPMQYAYVYDVQVAFLRTRYYYVKYMIYRPLVYKALHFPNSMTSEDAEGVAEFLRSCQKWPLTMSPTSRHKRLVPWLFCWSQTFLSILLIFHLTAHNPTLRSIRAQLCGPRFEADFDMSVALMQDWIRDLRAVDPLAQWCYSIMQPIYQLDP